MLMKKILLIIILLHLYAMFVNSQEWIPDPQKKYALTYPVGSYGNCLVASSDSLYLSGTFWKIGNVNSRKTARYCNGNWYPLRGGIDAYAMIYKNGNLFVASIGSSPSNSVDSPYVPVWGTEGLCRWESASGLWKPIGNNSKTGVTYTIEYYDNKIFIGGNMNYVGPLHINQQPAYFNGWNWFKAGYNVGNIHKLKRNNNDLLGSSYSNNFVKYEGDTTWSWSPYQGCGFYWKMETDTINGFLYVAGDFASICTTPPLISYGIAMWDGFKWHSFGTQMAYGVGAIKVYNGCIYAAIWGDTLADGTQVNFVARWDYDTEQWYPLGNGLNEVPVDIEVYKDTLYMTGAFTIAGGDTALGLARWYMPDTNCKYLRPMVHTIACKDTFNLWQGQAQVQFFNNNKYVQIWEWDFDDGGTASTQNPVHTFTDTGTYNVSVTVTDNGCVKTAEKTIVVMVLSGEDEITPDKIEFNIYPNPTTGDVTAECNIPAGMTNAQIMVNDSFGYEKFKRDLQPGYNKFEIRSSIWPKGWYVAGVYSANRQLVNKNFVKE